MQKMKIVRTLKKSLHLKTDLKVGYRPVHGLVYPDGTKRWVSGWFDLDSQGMLGGANEAPPPPAM